MGIKFSDFQNLFIGQFGEGVPRSFMGKTYVGAMQKTVQTVFALCTPGKVAKEIIGASAIRVTTFVSSRAGTNEGFQDKSMDLPFVVFPFFGQTHPGVTMVNSWLNPSGGGSQHEFSAARPPHTLVSGSVPVRPNSPLVGNFVTGETWNWFENLLRYDRILVSHGVALLNRVASGLEPFRCFHTVAARSFIPQPLFSRKEVVWPT